MTLMSIHFNLIYDLITNSSKKKKCNSHLCISGLSLLENKEDPLEDWRQKFWTSYKVYMHPKVKSQTSCYRVQSVF